MVIISLPENDRHYSILLVLCKWFFSMVEFQDRCSRWLRGPTITTSNDLTPPCQPTAIVMFVWKCMEQMYLEYGHT